ncbi:hypothetical protein BKA70DRAFT_531917 [Coprinopsis sp. MPI-PUGE-AT-0042]|nr:hypothetical protein BKA70DRAFT_531917 [Coprinopsis sp. MPI-PUGE-AT-0042]
MSGPLDMRMPDQPCTLTTSSPLVSELSYAHVWYAKDLADGPGWPRLPSCPQSSLTFCLLLQLLRARMESNALARQGTDQSPQAQGRDLNGAHIHNSNVTVAGRDSHHHAHYHYHFYGQQDHRNYWLGAILNLRKIHQDTLSLATPETGMWLIRDDSKFCLWIEPTSDL